MLMLKSEVWRFNPAVLAELRKHKLGSESVDVENNIWDSK